MDWERVFGRHWDNIQESIKIDTAAIPTYIAWRSNTTSRRFIISVTEKTRGCSVTHSDPRFSNFNKDAMLYRERSSFQTATNLALSWIFWTR